jgi:hypothetical protein
LFHNPNHTYRKYCSSYLKWLYSKLDNTYERKVEGKRYYFMVILYVFKKGSAQSNIIVWT